MKQRRIYLIVTESGLIRQHFGTSGEDAARCFVERNPHETVRGYVLTPKLTMCNVRGAKAPAEAEKEQGS